MARNISRCYWNGTEYEIGALIGNIYSMCSASCFCDGRSESGKPDEHFLSVPSTSTDANVNESVVDVDVDTDKNEGSENVCKVAETQGEWLSIWTADMWEQKTEVERLYKRAVITCANIECPELFRRPPPDCILQYSLDDCCSTSTFCKNKTEDVTEVTCNVGNETFIEGQKFYPSDDDCKSCVCQQGYDGTTNGPWCKKIKCGFELRSADRFRQGCAPVYYGTERCCSIGFQCRGDKCEFGSLRLNVNDQLSPSSNKCVECTCKTPPFVTCIQKTNC
uniref:VWFC domain-containing protein n=1 Tax=Timema tahoe TaxID=61484 RepID=A0A7R9P0X3_9NEOP|nr:unnamed protein product [Timema tahoe]